MKVKRHYRLPSGKELTVGEGTLVMGILNVTPDSFSDGGKWNTLDKALDHALSMVEDGAAIIDVGAESSRPGFVPVSAAEEIERLAPFLEHIVPKIPVPISIDTFKAQTARAAVELGADILNDIWGLQYAAEERGAMARVAAEYHAPVVVMHNQTGTAYRTDVIEAMQDFFRESCAIAEGAGVAKESLIFDPGIGFGKTPETNIEVLHRLQELCVLDGEAYPLLLGASRKSFIGYALDLPVEERLEATGAATVLGVAAGASIVRVHDVKEIARMCRMADIILEGGKHGQD
ncbi:MAG: dihydropteroate synthase [Selenomonas sp.]|uniref:dihydropteroate synthase n=1 Tax=uncultured Selenomonas sp. TaxID=159275 RepID=UPI0028EACFB6|nr:dihydropteroate synthase [uncultured Selenomonas sp.]